MTDQPPPADDTSETEEVAGDTQPLAEGGSGEEVMQLTERDVADEEHSKADPSESEEGLSHINDSPDEYTDEIPDPNDSEEQCCINKDRCCVDGTDRARLFIEDWLPIDAIGIESQRERGASSALPPLYFLHVWWARRPLIAARAAALGSLLPAWSKDWPEDLQDLFPSSQCYRDWFVNLLGIKGNPRDGWNRIQEAKRTNTKLEKGYDGKRAFTVGSSEEKIKILRRLLEITWKTKNPVLLDSTAGGGNPPGVYPVWCRHPG